MKIEDAIRIRPPVVTEGEWKRLLLDHVQARLLERPELPVTIVLAQEHEKLFDGYLESVGQSRPLPPPPEIQNAGLRMAWLVIPLLVASVLLQSYALFLGGLFFVLTQPRRVIS